MKKVTLYLDPWVDATLARIAADEEKTKSQLIREILADRVREGPWQQ